MKTRILRFKSGFVVVVVLVAVVLGYNAYESKMIRRGHLALSHFRLLGDYVWSEAQRLSTEAAGTPAESLMLAGSRTSQNMGDAEVDYKWEVCPRDKKVTEAELEMLRRKIESRVNEIIGFQLLTLRGPYPQVRLTANVEKVDSTFFQKRSILVSLKCNN